MEKTTISERVVATLLVEDESLYIAKKMEFGKYENECIKYDERFWNIVSKFFNIFEKQNKFCSKKTLGLFKQIEIGNLDFIKKSSVQQSKDAYGSDSDCEFEVPVNGDSTKCYSKKITVSTGMRTINLSYFLAKSQTRSKEVDTKWMYYETAEALKMERD